MNRLAKIRINNIDIKDYINMRFNGLPTKVKWGKVRALEMANGNTFSTNCKLHKVPSQEVLIDEPSQDTLKEISKVFGY